MDVCFLPLNKCGLVVGNGTASGGGCCLKDSLGEGGGLALFLIDPWGEARGLESGDWGRTVDGALRSPMPPLPLVRDGCALTDIPLLWCGREGGLGGLRMEVGLWPAIEAR